MKLAALHTIRALERALPPRALRAVLGPLARVACQREQGLQSELAVGLRKLPPDWLGGADPAQLIARERELFHCSRFMNFWPDRLARSPWREHIDATALANLPTDRPVVLATLHAGRTFMMHYTLRAMGLPAATFVGEPIHARSTSKLAKDRLAAGQGPAVFTKEQLKGAMGHLRQGNCLVVALDKPSDAMATVDFGGVPIRLSTGGIRMAQKSNATLAACLIVETAPWEYAIRLGQPLRATDPALALAAVTRDFADMLRTVPAQCGWEALDCLQ